VAALVAGVLIVGSRDEDLLRRVTPVRTWKAWLTTFDHEPRQVRRTKLALQDYRLLAAASQLKHDADREGTAASLHRLGVMQIALNDPRAAVATLRKAARLEPRNPLILSDLAGAHLELGSVGDDAAVIDALAAAEEAVRIDRSFAPALFNRALARAEIGSLEIVRQAWADYLAVDSDSGWADEARQHLAAATVPAPDFRNELERGYAETAAKPLVEKFPQESRTWAEGEILARWAEAFLKGDPSAERHLGVARTIGDELLALTGERLLAEHVVAIGNASADAANDLARAHLVYRTGRIRYSTGNPGEAEPVLRRAAALFERGRSPMAIVATYFAANAAFDQNRIHAAMTELLRIRDRTPRTYRALHAQVLWELGLCQNAIGRSATAAETLTHSASLFRAARETENEAFVRSILADIGASLGDFELSWRERVRSLRVLRAKPNARLLGAYLGGSVAALQENDLRKARALVDLESALARQLDQQHPLVLGLLRRAIIDFKAGRVEHAWVAIGEAERAVALIRDRALRARSEADLRFARALVLLVHAPLEAVRELTAAVDFHRCNGRAFHVPDLYLARGRAWKAAGRAGNALADFQAGIEQIESLRGAAPEGPARWGIFETARDLYAETIAMHLGRRDYVAAWKVADQTRARGLTDDLGLDGGEADVSMIDGDTTIVEFAILPTQLVTFTVASDGVQALTATIEEPELEARVDAFRDAIGRGDESAMQTHATFLYDLLIGPIGGDRRRQRMVIVPAGPLHALPFAALFDARANRFLVEQHEIVAVPSARTYFAAAAVRQVVTSEDTVLVVSSPARATEVALRGAAREGRAIAALYRGQRMLAGVNATSEQFLEALDGVRIVHFAGHGTADDATPGALVLADRTLSERDLAQRRLSTVQLVVLAACDTGRGALHRAEGPLSTARGFLAAGVPVVIGSLWPLDDDDAADFFIGLHRRLSAGNSAAKALRDTQIDAIRYGGEWKSLKTWAAAQAMGS